MGLRDGYLDQQVHRERGEKILYRAHMSWVPVIVSIAPKAMIFSAASGFVWGATENPLFGIGTVTLGAIVTVASQIPRIVTNIGTDIILTNQRIMAKKGIIAIKDDREASLGRIDSTDIDFNSLWERLFKYGDIEVKTIGDDNFFPFKEIAHPLQFKWAIQEAKQRYAPAEDLTADIVSTGGRRHRNRQRRRD